MKKRTEADLITIKLIPEFASAMVACLDGVQAGTVTEDMKKGLAVLRGEIASALIESLRGHVGRK